MASVHYSRKQIGEGQAVKHIGHCLLCLQSLTQGLDSRQLGKRIVSAVHWSLAFKKQIFKRFQANLLAMRELPITFSRVRALLIFTTFDGGGLVLAAQLVNVYADFPLGKVVVT